MELLRREKSLESLISFTEYTYPRYRTASIHQIIAEQLERVERGEIDRLMLLVPPRHGKSELASRRFPAWYLGRHPERQFISASASYELAEDFGRDVRNIIASPEYGCVFDMRLAPDSHAKGRWNTDQNGSYYAVGVGTDVMGRGAHVFLIDDPFGKMEDARSAAARKRVWNWYTGTVYNRLENDSAIVLINHRMHEDDLTGMLLAQQAAGGDRWEVVELKPDLMNGVALWPEKYPVEALDRIRLNTSPEDFSALYLQNPTPEGGNYFRDDWLRAYVHAPPRETLSIYGAGDYAVTTDGGDYTVLLIVGVDPEDRLYLLDLWRGQTSSHVWVDQWCQMVKRWKPLDWADETGQITSALGPYRDAEASRQRAYTSIQLIPHRGRDKGARAQSIRARMGRNGGGLYVPAYEPWYADFRSELLSFPAGKHDDQVDALGLVGQLLDMMVPGGREPKVEKPKVLPGYKPMQVEREDDWKSM